MLLAAEDLPSPHWKMIKDVALRPGFVGVCDEAEFRARKADSTLAVRAYEEVKEARWLTLRVLPLASTDDALFWSSNVKERAMNRRTSPRNITRESADEIVGMSDVGVLKGFGFEFTDESSGVHYFVKLTSGCVGKVGFDVRLMAKEDKLLWGDVTSIAALQGHRIREVLDVQESPNP